MKRHFSRVVFPLLASGIFASAQTPRPIPGPMIPKTRCLSTVPVPVPTELRAQAFGAHQIAVSWRGVANASRYYLMRRAGSSGSSAVASRWPHESESAVPLRPNPPNFFPLPPGVIVLPRYAVLDERLHPETLYTYHVEAELQDGRVGCSPAFSAQTGPPPQMITVSAHFRSRFDVSVSWPALSGAASYRISRDGLIAGVVKQGLGTLSFSDVPPPPTLHVSRRALAYKVEAIFSSPGLPDRTSSSTTTLLEPAPVRGFADLHTHQFSHLAFGGAIFHGVPDGNGITDLVDCDLTHGSRGRNDPVGNAMSAESTAQSELAAAKNIALKLVNGHNTRGYPAFSAWPRWNDYTHQQMWVDQLQRAWLGGLRLIVVLAVNNANFCGITAYGRAPGRSCADGEAVALQLQAAKDMQSHIDLISGGPGKGWYRVVTTPEQARAAIAANQLAVVLGVEVDEPLDCGLNSGCTVSDVDQRLSALRGMGATHVLPVHFLDNAFAGPALLHPIMNIANFDQTGSWYQAEDCTAHGVEFNLVSPELNGLNSLLQSSSYLGRYVPPVYPSGGNCNVRGLTPLGERLLRGMMRRGMIIDVDHMSRRAMDATLTLAEKFGYPVASSHSGARDISIGQKKSEGQPGLLDFARIRDLGGMVAPILVQGKTHEIASVGFPAHDCSQSSKSWAQTYLYLQGVMGNVPIGLGSDLNGLAGLPAPRFGPDACAGNSAEAALQSNRISYPFPLAIGSGTFGMSFMGSRFFDYNRDGVAHVGMFPDFVEDLKQIGLTPQQLEPLLNSAEGYIRMWERAKHKAATVLVGP